MRIEIAFSEEMGKSGLGDHGYFEGMSVNFNPKVMPIEHCGPTIVDSNSTTIEQ
jgi:hypothetical protein